MLFQVDHNIKSCKNIMSRKLFVTFILAAFLLLFIALNGYAQEEIETERLLRRTLPTISVLEKKPPKEDELFLNSFYERGPVVQGARKGYWSEFNNTFGYKHNEIYSYISISRLQRFDLVDYTGNFGTYLAFKDSYAHIETGFGWDRDFIYRLQGIAEYSHKLYKTLFFQAGYTYRNYDKNDTHLMYPGLIYYFGNSYVSANYGLSLIVHRDPAQFVTVNGDFAITDFLHLKGGVAVGQRLYDIFELPADKEFGYILFTALNLKLYKGISCNVGYSYSEEDPKFIKRSLSFSLTAKF